MVGHTSYYQTSPPIIRHCKNSWLKRWRLSSFFVCKICFKEVLTITKEACSIYQVVNGDMKYLRKRCETEMKLVVDN